MIKHKEIIVECKVEIKKENLGSEDYINDHSFQGNYLEFYIR